MEIAFKDTVRVPFSTHYYDCCCWCCLKTVTLSETWGFQSREAACCFPSHGSPGRPAGGEGCRETKTNGPHPAPASFDFFSVSSHFPETSIARVMGQWKRQRKEDGWGPKLKGGMFMEMGYAGWICKRFYFLWTLWKLRSRFVMRLLGTLLEKGFPDAAMVWSACSRVRRTDHGRWPVTHPHGWTKRPFIFQYFLFHRELQRGKSNKIIAFQNLLSSDKNKLQMSTYLINLLLSFNRISPAIRKKNISLSISFLQWFI